MAINTLTVASDGYLHCATKRLLVIAVAGYLNFCGVPPSPGGGVLHEREVIEGGKRIDWLSDSDGGKKIRIYKEDEEILSIIKIFIECQG